MGRKKFDKLSKEKKEEISNKINDKINEITRLKKTYQEELDIFDAVNDELKSLIECDLDCSTCDSADRGKCMQNFRTANIYFQKQCRILVHLVDDYFETFANILEGAGIIIAGLKEEKKVGDKSYFS